MSVLPYEVFEHTADIGLHVYGKDLPELFIHAAEGMESLMIPLEQIHPTQDWSIEVRGHDTVSLLIAWLQELVVLFDTEFLVCNRFTIESLQESHLKGRVFGEPYNASRHDLSSAIKAVTWHQAAIEQIESGYKARIIFDI